MNVLSAQRVHIEKPPIQESPIEHDLAERLPLRILLAEDNSINQKIALQLLLRMGYRADVVGNGLEVLEALHRQTYDVIFMDVHMPEMDGLLATQRVRQDLGVAKQPRIIAMTANAMQGDRENCLAAGMDDYVSKPIRIEELIQALKRCQPLPSGSEPQAQPMVSADSSNHLSIYEPNDPVENQAESQSASQSASEISQDSMLYNHQDDRIDVHDGAIIKESEEQKVVQITPIINEQILQKSLLALGQVTPDFLIQLVEEYLENSELLIHNALVAFSQNDAAGVEGSTHTLKSNSAFLGAENLARLCQELENLGRYGDLVNGAEAIEQLEPAYLDVKAALALKCQQWQAELTSPPTDS